MKFNNINIIYPYIRKSGGMETYVIDIIRGMSELGLKVTVTTMYVDPAIVFNNELVKFNLVKLPLFHGIKFLRNKFFDFFCMTKKIDGVPTISCCRYPGKADVAISAGTHIANRISIGKKIYRLNDFLSIWQEKKHFISSACVVAHSKSIEKELIRYYSVPKDNIFVLYPPTNKILFKRRSESLIAGYRRSLGISDTDIAILFPSGNHFRKGGDIILSALDGFDSRVKLIVAGNKRIEHNRVINVGFIDDMAALYSAVDATILASRYEPFGLVAIESVLCGTPVILSEYVAATEILDERTCFKFELNRDALIVALNKLIDLWDADIYDDFKLNMPIPDMDSIDEHCEKLLNLAYLNHSYINNQG